MRVLAEMKISGGWSEGEFVRASLCGDGRVDLRVYLTQDCWLPMATLRGFTLRLGELKRLSEMIQNVTEELQSTKKHKRGGQ